jgi:hypothetical protein
MHYNGSLPTPYSSCPYVSTILYHHCCANGLCTPSWFNKEFERYEYNNWDGLGNPKPSVSGTWKGGNGKGKWKFGHPCMRMGMEPAWLMDNAHWPPLGLDGLPVENFSFAEWGSTNLGRHGKGEKGEKGSRGLRWNGSAEDRAVIWKRMTGSLRTGYVEGHLTDGNDGLGCWPLMIIGIGALFTVLLASKLHS